MIRKTLTHNAEDGGRPIGVGYYMPGYEAVATNPVGFHSRRYPNGVVRRVWTDKDGRAAMVGWFWEDWS